MASMTMTCETITFDTIGQAYIAEHEASKALAAGQTKFAAGRISAARLQTLTEAATATRRERQRVVNTFAAGVHANSVRSYEAA
jgi:hypothetical protein